MHAGQGEHQWKAPPEIRTTLPLTEYAYAYIVVPLVLVVGVILALHFLGETFEHQEHIFSTVSVAFLMTFVRLFIAYMIAAAFAVLLALWVNSSDAAMRVLLPVYDTLQSIPYLIFLPVMVLIAAHFGILQMATIAILVLGMIWPLTFNMITGLRIIPAEIQYAGNVLGARGLAFFQNVTLPAITPSLITGSLLAWGAGWNLIVVAEVLHTYAHDAGADVMGIGSVLISSETSGSMLTFVIALLTVAAFVVVMNFFVWQRLLVYAERFRFE